MCTARSKELRWRYLWLRAAPPPWPHRTGFGTSFMPPYVCCVFPGPVEGTAEAASPPDRSATRALTDRSASGVLAAVNQARLAAGDGNSPQAARTGRVSRGPPDHQQLLRIRRPDDTRGAERTLELQQGPDL